MGLDAIFSADKADITEKKLVGTNQILLSHIIPSPFQARKNFSTSAIEELASSIVQHGLLQPIIVRAIAENKYELLAGERRLKALQYLNKITAPAIICDANDEAAMAFGLIENIQRENLNAIEEAAAYDRLLNEFHLSHDQLAEKMGKSRSHMTNMLRIHRLPTTIKQFVIEEKLSAGHARAILALPIERHIEIAQLIIQRELSVRQTEEFIKRLLENDQNTFENKPFLITPELKNNLNHWQAQLTQKYSAEIKVNINTEGRGRVQLEVNSPDALSLLIEKLIN